MSFLFAAILCVAPVSSAPVSSAQAQRSGTPVTFEHASVARRMANPDLTDAELRAGWPHTVAESSAFTRSSTLSEVEAFLQALGDLPSAERLTQRTFGTTTEGRNLTAVTVREGSTGEPAADSPNTVPNRAPSSVPNRARVLVNANIHGGEIEGKVAVQILLRELALGYHSELLENLEITFVPVFNADGNDRIARTNRVTQNGPDGGVGERANAMGLDLNRDFVKLETPEVRALTTLVREVEPHAFMDLHTTNGSPHGYDLTYSPSLSPNVPADLARYTAERFFPEVRATLAQRDDIYTYDYGNFEYAPRERGSRGERGDPIGWNTYDSRPRFGTNLMGLRGTVSILSEAYSYLPYERRVLATYAFLLECLRVLARDAELIKGLGTDAASAGGSLGVDATLASIGKVPIRVSRYDEVKIDLDPEQYGLQEGVRRVAAGPGHVVKIPMEVRSRFTSARQVEYTEAFLVLDPSDALVEVLALHLGEAELDRIGPEGETLTVDRFVIDEATRSSRVFQGHREASVRGHWVQQEIEVPEGSLRVRSNRLVAHLLHPESDDSLTTWNYFDAQIFPGDSPGAPNGGEDSTPTGVSQNPDEPMAHPVALIR